MWKCKKRIKVITENTTVYDTDFSGWLAVNTGAVDVVIDKITVPPGKGIDMTSAIPPYCLWDSPIQILVPATGEVVLTQLIFKNEGGENMEPGDTIINNTTNNTTNNYASEQRTKTYRQTRIINQ